MATLSNHPTGPRPKVLFGGLILANLSAWVWAFTLFAERPAILGSALLAWVFGLRHAVDADHIAAIDNVVRKLIHAGAAPHATGLFFALGHSTVVVVATMLLAAAAVRLEDGGTLKTFGTLAGTSVSAVFLLLIAIINLGILAGLLKTIGAIRARDTVAPKILKELLPRRGLLARLLGTTLRMVTRAWHMYPLGLLFGLGFDTATEIGLLSMSATEAAHGLSFPNVLVFPALFAAAMTLVDTADGMLMMSAYRWALVDPLRKLWYNLTITAASVLIAVLIGGVELLGLFSQRFGLMGGVWDIVAGLNDNLTGFGCAVIGLFAFAWAVSIAIYRIQFGTPRRSGSAGGHDRDNPDMAEAAGCRHIPGDARGGFEPAAAARRACASTVTG